MVRIIFFWVLYLSALSIHAQVRQAIDFNADWHFQLGDDSLAREKNYDDSRWRKLQLPHDWSIESDFIKDAPATNQGGSLPGGIGWYRKTFVLPSGAKGQQVQIAFDGVYQQSEVWVNGHYLGKRPNGYMPFQYIIDEYLLPAPQKNTIAVRVDNSKQPNSRWYTGSGIYRDVTLHLSNKVAFVPYEIFISTKSLMGNKVVLDLRTVVFNRWVDTALDLQMSTEILDQKQKQLYHRQAMKKVNRPGQWNNSLTDTLQGIMPWSLERPYLYTLRLVLYQRGKKIDEYKIKFGFREAQFHKEKGFVLNGRPMLLKGVCMHHDLGALGAAFNKVAAKRQLNMLKEMGCNAIRFSHNPPAAAMLDLCDEMGFLVIDEAFDNWTKKKNKFDYHLDFAQWHERDLLAMVTRDRNHPSVIAWSVGNENREQFDSSGIYWGRKLVEIVQIADTTRPVIAALTETMPDKNFIVKSGAMELLGFNYKLYDYPHLPQRFPGKMFIATETASALSTRGVYQFPADSIRIWPPDYKAQDTFNSGNKDFTAAAYDNTHAYWGGTHEKTWLAVKKHPHMTGIFVWSGFDFLGEPLPYPAFPSRSSYYGIIDLAGFPKDVFYMYQSEWSKKNVLHLFPHWNWKKGDTVDVWAYYNHADEAELFVNGKSAGKRTKNDSTLHVSWRVPFEAGQIRVRSRKKGQTVMEKAILTAGPAYRIELLADKKQLKADGKDLSFITTRILDREGNLVPDADDLIQFTVSGNGQIAGTDNGYQADTRSLKSPARHAWKGLALLILQSNGKKGNITLKATAPGLKPATIILSVTD